MRDVWKSQLWDGSESGEGFELLVPRFLDVKYVNDLQAELSLERAADVFALRPIARSIARLLKPFR